MKKSSDTDPNAEVVDPLESFLDYIDGVKQGKTRDILSLAERIIADPSMASERQVFLEKLRLEADEMGLDDMIHSSNYPPILASTDLYNLVCRGFVKAVADGTIDWTKICMAMHSPDFVQPFRDRIIATPADQRAACWNV